MSLNDLVQSVVSSDGAGLKQAGFGTIMCVAYHTKYVDLVREYEELSGLVADGFETYSPAYKMATAAFAQDPRPEKIKLGRLSLPATQTIRWVPTVTTQGYVQSLTIEVNGTKLTAQYTNGAGATVATIIDNMLIAVEALDAFDSLLAVTDGTTYMQIVTDAGIVAYYSDWTGTYEDVTTDPGIATDLAAIRLADEDWYGLALELNAKLIQEEASDWAEAEKVIHCYTTSDWKAYDSSETTDIGDVLQGKSYAYSVSMFNRQNTDEYDHVAMLAERFPHDPGQPGAGGTWFGKTLAGVTAHKLTPTQKTNLKAKNYNVYVETSTRSHTLKGQCAGGEFVDKIRFLDWVNARIEEEVAQAKLDADGGKVPYTDPGVSVLAGKVSKIMDLGVQVGGFSADPYPTVTAGPVSAQLSADKAARVYKGLKWKATLAGAIHFTGPISGTVLT
jgi:hypothetical protein